MQQLSNLDTSFLRLERPGAPMHVGATMVFDAPADGVMSFERLAAHLGDRLHTARVFRERLLMPVTPLENPRWIADRPVDLAQHLSRATVRGPLDLDALSSLREAFFAELLPRDRPLWSLLYVEEEPPARGRRKAVAGGRFAILMKVHHAAVDGVSAEAVLTGLLDGGVAPRALPPDNWQPEAPPAKETLSAALRQSLQGAPLRELGTTLSGLGARYLKRLANTDERRMPSYFRAPATPLNVAISAQRVFPAAHLPMPVLQQLRKACEGSKLNDVVLAVCGGALRRYLAEHGGLPDPSLVAMAPISRRAADQKHSQGNQVSSMLVSLATDTEDPLARLARISAGTRLAKAYNREMPVEALLAALPSTGPALFLEAWKRFNVSRHVPPLFNVVVTNVPGSPVPLYFDGAPMHSMTGTAGIYDGVGLVLVVTSYADTITLGITSTPEILPDPDRFVACLHESLQALAAAAGIPAAVVPAAESGELMPRLAANA